MARDRLAAFALTGAMSLVLTTSAVTQQLPQTSIPLAVPDGREFRVRIMPPTAAIDCQAIAYQAGAFGGYGGPMSPSVGGGTFTLRTGVGDKPAKTLKAAIWCKGSGFALLDLPELESSTYERTVRLAPLKELPMAGRVRPSADGVSFSGAELQVSYIAFWLCGFFNQPDCMVPQWRVASGRIGDDGTFRVMLPDFMADPAITPSAFSPIAGEFSLRAHRSAPPYDYRLEQEGTTRRPVAVAKTYPELLLVPRRN